MFLLYQPEGLLQFSNQLKPVYNIDVWFLTSSLYLYGITSIQLRDSKLKPPLLREPTTG